MQIVITILEQKRSTGFFQSLMQRSMFSNFTTQLVCSTLQDTYTTNLQEVLLYYLQFSIKVKATLSPMNMMNSKMWHLVIRIPAVLFKTDCIQSPHENLSSAKFYHPKPKHCFKLSARRISCYFPRKHNAESASFTLESSPVIAQSTVIYLSASHKCKSI